MVYGMKRLSFLLGLLLCLPVVAQQVYRARVADGRTGETLPMARIYISQHNCTLSNDEGDFSIQARAEDVMEISYMGYETQRWTTGACRACRAFCRGATCKIGRASCRERV